MLITIDKPEWNISHGLHGLGGLGGLLEVEDYGMGGLGMTQEEARVMLATGNGTPDQLKAANAAYYGPPTVSQSSPGTVVTVTGGYYAANPSVQAASPVNNPVYPGNSEVAPNLYAMDNCSPLDSTCVARNAQKESANIVLTSNTRNAYDTAIANYNHALNVQQTGNVNLPDPNNHFTQQAVPVVNGASPVAAIVQGGQALARVVGQAISDVVTMYSTPGQVVTAINGKAAGQSSAEVVPTSSSSGSTPVVTQNNSSPSYSQNGSAGQQIMQAIQGLAQTGNAAGTTTTLTWSDIWTQYEWWIIAALGIGGYLAFSSDGPKRGRG